MTVHAVETIGDGVVARRRRVNLRRLSPRVDRFSGIYVGIALVILFCILEPESFATINNVRVIAANEAITAIITLGLVFSLSAGMFDLSIGGTMSLAAVVVVWLQIHGAGIVVAIILTAVGGGVVGAINGLIITRMGVDSLICTLGTGSILTAIAVAVSGSRTLLLDSPTSFTRIGRDNWFNIPSTVWIMLVLAAATWIVLAHTPLGRRIYAVGGNAPAARLTGVRVALHQVLALTVSGTVAAVAGVVLASQLGSAPISGGTPYLLPAFSAAFLGATQIYPGRFNVLGSLVAIYLLGIGVKGLQLKYPSYLWIRDLFVGTALVCAVALAAVAARRRSKAM
jgi:ribose transport system permease protein